MGGAERTARKRRQELAAGREGAPKPRSGPGGQKVLAIAGSVLLVAAVIVGGIVWTDASKNATEGVVIPAVQPAASGYEVRRDGTTVVSGGADAGTTIDVYVDFLCPVCGDFEEAYGDRIDRLVAAGELRVRTHPLPLLVDSSDPPGYSLDAADAALLAADEGRFAAYHDSLFAHQPEEGARGYDDEQLIRLGRDLGIDGRSFAEGVRNGKYDEQLRDKLRRVTNDPSLRRDLGGEPGFGTPTVVANGSVVDTSDERWLDRLVGGKAGR